MAGTGSDVIESLVALLVQPGVQPSERRFALLEQCVVDKREDTGRQRAGGRGTGDGDLGTVPEDCEVKPLGSEIGVGAAACDVCQIEYKRTISLMAGYEVNGRPLRAK
jgi:hypothetical protein